MVSAECWEQINNNAWFLQHPFGLIFLCKSHVCCSCLPWLNCSRPQPPLPTPIGILICPLPRCPGPQQHPHPTLHPTSMAYTLKTSGTSRRSLTGTNCLIVCLDACVGLPAIP